MGTSSGGVNAPSIDLRIARFFAAILFTLAAIIGLPASLALVGTLFTGDWRAVLVILGIGGLAWGLAWLGRVLWTGRSIPGWFLATCFVAFFVIPLAAVARTGSWMEVLALVGMIIPMLTALPAIVRGRPTKPARPKEFDDLA